MSRKIIILAVVAVIVLSYFGSTFLLSSYNTGLTLNTDTYNFDRWNGYTGIDTNELVDEELFVTSWLKNGRSIMFVCSGSIKFE